MDAPITATTPHEMLGGSQVVAAIVDRFYRLMDEEEGYRALRALHAEDLSTVREGLVVFLDAWLGGPKQWFSRGKCIMSLHRGFPISQEISRQWCEAMARAIADQPGIDERLAVAMTQRLMQMANAMVNDPAAREQAG